MKIIIYRLGSPITTLIDDLDYDLIKGKTLSIDKGGYVRVFIKGYGKMYLHRFIFQLTDRKIEIDHINHNRLDNRRSNLRTCNHSQNIKNQVKRKTLNLTSKYKGVHYNPVVKRYVVEIKVNYKRISLKTYLNEEDAARAYNNAALKYHKEYAQLNSIPEPGTNLTMDL